MSVRVGLLIPTLLCALPASGNDLKELYDIAVERDAVLQAARYQRDALIEARPQALAALLPQIVTQSSATRERLVLGSGQVNDPATANCNLTNGERVATCYGDAKSLQATVTQTVWDYGAFSQLKAADFEVASAIANFQGVQQDLMLRVAQAYFAILSASDQLTTNRKQRDAFGTLLAQATTRAQVGVGPRSDLAQAQAFYDATEQSVIDAENALDDANLALVQIVGIRDRSVAPLREDIPLKPPDPASVDAWVASARQDNFNVMASRLSAEAAAKDIAVQKGRALPVISLTGSASSLHEDPVLGGNQNADIVGISFTLPLFQGGAIASAVRRSRALYKQSQATLDVVQRDTERQVRAAFRNVVIGIQRITAARRAVDSGQVSVDASRRNVEFGTGTEFDLLNAQTNYYAAVRAYNQSRYDYLTSVLVLKQQAGHLSPIDLIAIDDLLVTETPSGTTAEHGDR